MSLSFLYTYTKLLLECTGYNLEQITLLKTLAQKH